MIESIKRNNFIDSEVKSNIKKKFPNYPNVFYINFEKLDNVVLYYGSEWEHFVIRKVNSNFRKEYKDLENFIKTISELGYIKNKKICDIRELGFL